MTRAAQAERTLKLARQSTALEDAQRFAEHALSYCTPECREAVTLAVCELGENLLKYAGGDELEAGTIGVSVEDDTVRVRATNRVSSEADARRVRELVSRIESSGGAVRELYRARLQELFEHPELPRAELGLLRMAFEGGFHLTCSYERCELQIVAERTCAGAP
ncbi:MAG TPA: DUF6272 family protein [Polyangiaceae bacterium]|nr:DUF6272 family protein [Polyangiaceae bacterium]